MNTLAWLALLAWVGIPLLVILGASILWRRSRTVLQKWLVVAASVAILSGPMLMSIGVKWWFDRQVRELCAKDGGVKVYEPVKLPTERFDKWGMVDFYRPTQGENALGTDYIFRLDVHYYQRGNPEMSRWHYQIIRRSDNKLLGETILYGRGGGDLPGPWHDSSFRCPDPNKAGEVSLIRQVFLKH